MTEIILRPYQQEAVNRMMLDRFRPGNSLIVLPTGAGKSLVIACAAKEMKEDILILQPSKELLEQNVAKLAHYVDHSEIGIFSASMGERTIRKYTFATIQSIYKNPEPFKHFKLVIIDEADGLNPKSLNGMYHKFFESIGEPKIYGLTATPYRLDIMYIRDRGGLEAVTTTKLINRMKGFFWQKILYNINFKELLDQGYLCPLEYYDRTLIDQLDIRTNKSGSDFDMAAYDIQTAGRDADTLAAITHGRTISKSVLVFCATVSQAQRLAAKIGPDAGVVHAKTPPLERDRLVRDFKEGRIPVILNMGVLTCGFDHPALECIVLLRPTRSIRLYYQMLGRGVRLSPGKTSCKVIDLTSTVKHLGRVESIRLEKDLLNKWQLLSETGSWHCKELYRHEVKPKEVCLVPPPQMAATTSSTPDVSTVAALINQASMPQH